MKRSCSLTAHTNKQIQTKIPTLLLLHLVIIAISKMLKKADHTLSTSMIDLILHTTQLLPFTCFFNTLVPIHQKTFIQTYLTNMYVTTVQKFFCFDFFCVWCIVLMFPFMCFYYAIALCVSHAKVKDILRYSRLKTRRNDNNPNTTH